MPNQISTPSQTASSQSARDVQVQEHDAKASASGGLNLNILGALSGALSSKSRKTTRVDSDGVSESVEDREDQATANVLARGQGSVYAAAEAEESGKRVKAKEGGKRVDHLGIEG
ncbi:Protein S-acyltransferase [Ascochyta lentis]